MSAEYILSPNALDDLYQLWHYIAEQASVATADKVEERLFSAFKSLARMRGQGHLRADLTKLPVLFFPVYSYLIVYQPDANPLVIHGILHGARDIERVLKGRPL